MYVSWNVNCYKILSLVDRANKSEIANFESWAFEFSAPFHKKNRNIKQMRFLINKSHKFLLHRNATDATWLLRLFRQGLSFEAALDECQPNYYIM